MTGRRTSPRWARVFGAVVLGGAIAIAAPTTAEPTPGAPGTSDPPGRNRIIVETVVGSQGPVTRVRLEGWPPGPVTVSVCGNEATRASQDCDLVGSKGLGVERNGGGSVILAMTPPIGCPCVIRVATPDAMLVRLLPVVLPGVPWLAADQRPAAPVTLPVATQIEVTATLEDDVSFLSALAGSAGGPVDRTAVVTLHNRGATPLPGLTMVAAVGRDSSSGAPVTVPAIGTLAPGEKRQLRLPVSLDAPSVGEWVVFGRVTGLDRPVSFEARTAVRPWTLVAILGVAAALLASRRVRRRRRAGRRSPEGDQPANATRTADDDPTKAPAPAFQAGG